MAPFRAINAIIPMITCGRFIFRSGKALVFPNRLTVQRRCEEDAGEETDKGGRRETRFAAWHGIFRVRDTFHASNIPKNLGRNAPQIRNV